MGDERRGHRRVDVHLPVTVRVSGGRLLEGVVENLGVLGALVSTPDLEAPLDFGDEVSLTITTGDGTIEVAGEVLRLQQEFTAGDIRRAFAVRFARTITLPA
jgi:hypothetical protein